VSVSVTLVMAQQRPVFRGESTGVRFDVSVLEGTRPLGGLTSSDFDVLDNRVRQRIAVAETHDAQLDIAVARPPLQTFSTERRKLVQTVISTVTEGLNARDRLAFVIASAAPVVARPLTSFERETAVPAEPANGAALRDGIIQGLGLFDVADRRKAVLIVTDGRYDQSWTVPAAFVRAVDRSEAHLVIAAVDADATDGWDTKWNERGIPREEVTRVQHAAYLALPRWLLESMYRSGGFAVKVGDASSVDRVRAALLQLRSEYVITYTPADVPGWHDVKVSVRKKNVTVIARAGYWR